MRWLGFRANRFTSYPRSGPLSNNGTRFLAFSLIIFGIIIGYFSFNDAYPEYSSLHRFDGQVTWIHYSKRAINFRLRTEKNSEMLFSYAVYGGDADNVYRTLAKKDGRPISVLFDPAENTASIFSKEESFQIFELSFLDSNFPFQSYSRIKKGWVFNNRVGETLSIALILIGLWLPSTTRNHI